MARAQYTELIKNLAGATAPNTIHRQKHYHDAKGRIIGAASPEVYRVTKPRDLKRKPAVGDELANQKLWGKACYLYDQSLQTDEGVAYWQNRFEAQLAVNKGSKPDPYATLDKKTKCRKRYKRFDAFVRAIIRNQLAHPNHITPQHTS